MDGQDLGLGGTDIQSGAAAVCAMDVAIGERGRSVRRCHDRPPELDDQHGRHPHSVLIMRNHFSSLVVILMVGLAAAPASAQIRVNPTGVNVSSQGDTTAFLTFGPLNGYTPAESLWCGDVFTAAPAVGLQCDPSTIYGALPARYDRSSIGSNGSFTDIMSVPASVGRRAYQAAVAGKSAEFFYVRHFLKPGSPDQFVAVTCRLTGGGARVPLSLVDVQLASRRDACVAGRRGREAADLRADRLHRDGRLQAAGRSFFPARSCRPSRICSPRRRLPISAARSTAVEIDRFNVFLAPTGCYTPPVRSGQAADGRRGAVSDPASRRDER
jgi:hypothetical protein